MPGIFGCIDRNGNNIPEKIAVEMATSMKHDDSYIDKRILDPCLLGVVGLDFLLNFNLAHDKEMHLIGVTRGNIYNKSELCAKFGIESEPSYMTDSSFIIELYKRKGLDFAKYLNGLFSLAIYDKKKDSVVVANDRFGFYPMFYTLTKKRFVFASEAKAILKNSNSIPKINKVAIPEFFTFSCLLGNKSFFKDVKMMMPANTLVYDKAKDKVKTRRYWDFEIPHEKTTSVDGMLKEFKKLMKRTVENMVRDRKEVGVFLSGGVDSRIVAGLASETRTDVVTFTFGVKGCPQQKIAKEVADTLGVENVFYEIPSDFIANYGDKIVYNGDGLVRIRDSHFIGLLEKIRRRVNTVLIGTFGESLFGYNIKKKLLNSKKPEEAIDFIFENCIRGLPLSMYQDVFCDDFGTQALSELKESFRKTLDSTMMNKTINSPIDVVDYWDFKVRMPRYIYTTFQFMNWFLETRHPFLDNELVDFFAFRLPADLRIGRKFLQKALNYCLPSLRHIRLEHNWVPPDSHPFKIFLGRARRFAMYKTRSTIERLTRGRLVLKPTDYRDYGLWLRTGSRDYTEKILLNPKALERGYFKPEYIKKIVKEHMTAKKNHEQMICDLINFELFNRIFLDKKEQMKNARAKQSLSEATECE